jgi:hypothetical protein
MGVQVLQTARKLVVQSVDKADDAPANADDAVLFTFGCTLYQFVVLGSDLLHRITVIADKDHNEAVYFALRGQPQFDGHIGGDGGVVVKARRDQGEQNTYSLVWCDGDFE